MSYINIYIWRHQRAQHVRDPRIPHQVAAAGFEAADAARIGTADHHVEDDVVAAIHAGKILASIIDDMVGADIAQHVGLVAMVDGGDLGAHSFRDLQREAADAAAGAVDQ